HSPILHHFTGKTTPNSQLTIAIEYIDDEKRDELEQLGKTVKVIPQDENTPQILQMLERISNETAIIQLGIEDVVQVIGAGQIRAFVVDENSPKEALNKLTEISRTQNGMSGQAIFIEGPSSMTLHEVNALIALASDAALDDANVVFGYGLHEEETGLRFFMAYPATA
ncbi:MAG: hypothetical protein GY822_03485, partial [Deltaproteobacteria bacterium]|nr:hypothetical protein [Deltaproteobacteria bacterium]